MLVGPRTGTGVEVIRVVGLEERSVGDEEERSAGDETDVTVNCDIESVVSTLCELDTLVCSTSDVLVTRTVEGAAEDPGSLDTTEVTTTT